MQLLSTVRRVPSPHQPTPDPFSLASGLSFTRVQNEGIVLGQAGGQVHVLNGTAAQLSELLAGGADVEAAVRQLAATSPDQVRADVGALLHEMAELGLVRAPPAA